MAEDMVKRAKRQAMLDAQARWLSEAEKADTATLRSIAVVIADAFGKEAEQYKEDLRTRTHGWGWADEHNLYDPDGFGIERGAAPVLPDEG